MRYDPTLDSVRRDPFPAYAYLREHAPVYWVESLQGWAITRYDDVKAVLLDVKSFSSQNFFERVFGDLVPVPNGRWMIAMDPPDHTKLRMLANAAFTPAALNKMDSIIESHVAELLDDIAQTHGREGEFELYDAFTSIFPVSIIAIMLGANSKDRRQFRHWVEDMNRAARRHEYNEDQIAVIRKSVTDLRLYMEDVIARYRTHPADNIVSALIRAEEDAQRLSSLEVLCLSLLILQAGTDTTGLWLGNAFAELGRRPSLLEDLQANEDLIAPFLDEVNRFSPPVHVIPRLATRDHTLHGVTIKAGQLVLPNVASANRDAAHFADPDTFDFERKRGPSTSFGFGPHFCIGHALARREAVIALRAILRRWRLAPKMDQLELMDHWMTRGVVKLPIEYAPRL